MLRLEWKFTRLGGELAEAAQRQLDRRRERLEYWREKKGEVMAKIRESGIDINESMAAQIQNYSSTQFGNRQAATVTIDEQMLEDLNECLDKIKTHDGAVRDYTAWVQVLGSNRNQSLELDQNDWMFFFGVP